jgi:hypothetical protein
MQVARGIILGRLLSRVGRQLDSVVLAQMSVSCSGPFMTAACRVTIVTDKVSLETRTLKMRVDSVYVECLQIGPNAGRGSDGGRFSVTCLCLPIGVLTL